MDALQFIAERRIEEAVRDGVFSDLPGAGKPLDFEESFVPEDLRLAYRVLKNAGFAPPEIELKKEIFNLSTLLKSLNDETARIKKIKEFDFKLAKLGMLLNRPAHLEEYESRIYEKFLP